MTQFLILTLLPLLRPLTMVPRVTGVLGVASGRLDLLASAASSLLTMPVARICSASSQSTMRASMSMSSSLSIQDCNLLKMTVPCYRNNVRIP